MLHRRIVGWRAARIARHTYLSGTLERAFNRYYYQHLFISAEALSMGTKFSEDVVPLTDLKANPGRVVKHAAEAHRPVLLTSRGRGVAIVQSLTDYEASEEERAFMRAVVTGLADLEAGRELSLAEAKSRLGLN